MKFLSSPYRVKICGIRSHRDIEVISQGMPDAAGFIVGALHPTPDAVTPGFVKEAKRILPQSVRPVLVTHLTTAEEILRLTDETAVLIVQLHGFITPRETERLAAKAPYLTLIKAIHANRADSVASVSIYQDLVDAILLDTAWGNCVGGTGRTHNWKVSAKIVKTTKIPVILAGGLNPENVESAIRQVRPSGVDVNSGVEDQEGNKDLQKVLSFIERSRSVLSGLSPGISERFLTE